jgi:nucleotide-binding universal stress UspA family protein
MSPRESLHRDRPSDRHGDAGDAPLVGATARAGIRSDPSAATPDPAAGPLAISTVLVPLSRSAASESALAPAAEVARRFGAQLHVLTVGVEQEEIDAMAERVSELATTLPATLETWVDWDVPGGILAASHQHRHPLVCMTSHAYGRLGELVVTSHTTALLAEATDPVLLVGPAYEPARTIGDGPVFACVDGSEASERVIPEAARWASALDVGLRIVTVAEPALAGLDDREPYRAFGPHRDPQAYVEELAERTRRPDLEVSGLAVFDAIGVAQGLATELETAACSLLAVTTHAHTGLKRVVFGSQASAILHHSQVPVLVVP